jgi:predicted nucleotidyltransferase
MPPKHQLGSSDPGAPGRDRTRQATSALSVLATRVALAYNGAMEEAAPRRLLDAIARALAPLDEVQAALLFGSRATGRARPESDIDVAVLLRQESPEGGTSLQQLLGALSQELAADRLDVVILNTAPPALAFQVLKYGAVAFERDVRHLHRFRVRTYGAHADYEPVERFFREVIKRRALGGVGRG